jgi:hypothetical protein
MDEQLVVINQALNGVVYDSRMNAARAADLRPGSAPVLPQVVGEVLASAYMEAIGNDTSHLGIIINSLERVLDHPEGAFSTISALKEALNVKKESKESTST